MTCFFYSYYCKSTWNQTTTMKILQKIIRLFGINKNTKPAGLKGYIPSSNNKISKDAFQRLKEEDRMVVIMKVGDVGDLRDFDLMESALTDSSKSVKFAALKRIHNFSGHPDTIPLIQTLESKNSQRELEPYYSMALFRLSLISEEELKYILNSSN